MAGYKNVNYSFTINLNRKIICVPHLKLSQILSITELLKLIHKNKKKLNKEVYMHNDNFCILIILDVDFKCCEYTSCEECIFKPKNIKKIGLGNFKKFISLSMYKSYLRKNKRILNIIKK